MFTFFADLYLVFLTSFSSYFPVFFAQKVCGRLVYVSKFPVLQLFYCESPGWYFVDSFVFMSTGELQIGLEVERGSVEYFTFSDIEITDIAIGSSKIAPSSKSVRELETVRALG